MNDDIERVKKETWFYEFELPDGSKTKADYPPDILRIHTSRRDALRRILDAHVPESRHLIAADISSHQGYFTAELAKRFMHVRGYEYRPESIEKSKLMMQALNVSNVDFVQFDIQKEEVPKKQSFDFVLLYGLLYHMENPVHSLRVASAMSRQHLLIDTQIFPYDISGRIEDSAYMHQRPVEGIFSLTPDYSAHREGGSTDFALVPSLNALTYLLSRFGFTNVKLVEPREDYYEQFLRRTRVIIHAQRV